MKSDLDLRTELPHWIARRALAVLFLALGGTACSSDDEAERLDREESAATTATALSAPEWQDADWAVFEEKARWALAERLDSLPLGEAIARLGQTLVGTAYVPQTLEVPGPERLVINFRELDCVTFVENVLALSSFVRAPGAGEVLTDRAAAEDHYEALLTRLRYRGGRIEGYPSRLHYFTDWIADNEEKALLRDVSEELGAVRDSEPIDFMTTHASAYRQLADSGVVSEVRKAEERLTTAGRLYIPENRIADIAAHIQNGDVIAATSTVKGLDVAHTGLALWVDGRLHLLHAPLVGEAVEISDVPLAERIQGLPGQDGIMVARPIEAQ
jgi:hypothetical protein